MAYGLRACSCHPLKAAVDGASLMFLGNSFHAYARGGTQVWFWQGCAATEFESRPIQIPIFQEKVTHSYTNRFNFWPNFEQNHPIFPKFS